MKSLTRSYSTHARTRTRAHTHLLFRSCQSSCVGLTKRAVGRSRYKRDFAEFASVISDDAKVIEKEMVEAKGVVKERAAVLREQAAVAAAEAIQSADAATGGNLTATRKAIHEGIVDTVQIVQAVGSELGLTETQRGKDSAAGALLREAIAPLRVDRYAEMVQALRADQATFAAGPTEYAFIEWREARTRPDGTRLPLSPTESDAKSDAESDERVQRWLAELVPEVLKPEVFWDRYLFRLASFEAAEVKRAALIKSAAVHRSPTDKGGCVLGTTAAARSGTEDEELDGWGTSDGEDEPHRQAEAHESARAHAHAADYTPDAAHEILKKLESELELHTDGDDDLGSNGWGADSEDDTDKGPPADTDRGAHGSEHSAAAPPEKERDSTQSRTAAAEASAAKAARVAELRVAATEPQSAMQADSDDDSLDSWGAASLSD